MHLKLTISLYTLQTKGLTLSDGCYLLKGSMNGVSFQQHIKKTQFRVLL